MLNYSFYLSHDLYNPLFFKEYFTFNEFFNSSINLIFPLDFNSNSIPSNTYLRNLVDDVDELGKTLPMGRVGSVDEIGRFVKSIIENDIKYLTGVTINFDGGHSNYVI